MKTSGFIKRVKELGYEFKISESVTESWIDVYNENDLIARVYGHLPNRLDTNFGEYVTYMLFDLCVEYARTPIEERKDVKKYYLYNPVKGAYFNYYVERGLYDWFSPTEDYGVQTKFTEEEIKNHELRDLMKLLVKEEVE